MNSYLFNLCHLSISVFYFNIYLLTVWTEISIISLLVSVKTGFVYCWSVGHIAMNYLEFRNLIYLVGFGLSFWQYLKCFD